MRRILILLMSAVVFLAAASPASGTSLSLPIVEDVVVRSDAPTQLFVDENLGIGYLVEDCPPPSPWDTTPHYCPSYNSRVYLSLPIDELVSSNIRSTDIISATINLYQYYGRTTKPFAVNAYAPLDPWSALTLTWDTQPTLSPRLSATHNIQTPGWRAYDITQWLRQVLSGNVPPYGVMLKASPESVTGGTFWSSRCLLFNPLNQCAAGQTPFLHIDYLDNETPTKPVPISPPDGFLSNTRTIDFSAYPSTDPEGETLHYSLLIDGNELFAGESSEPMFTHSFDRDGIFLWTIGAEDSRGNSSYSDVCLLTIDTTPPAPPVLNPVPIKVQATVFQMSWQPSTDELGEPIEYLAVLSSDLHVREGAWQLETSAVFSDIVCGAHQVSVIARDAAGNTSSPSTGDYTFYPCEEPPVNDSPALPPVIPDDPGEIADRSIVPVSESDTRQPTPKRTAETTGTPSAKVEAKPGASPSVLAAAAAQPAVPALRTCIVDLYTNSKTYAVRSCKTSAPVLTEVINDGPVGDTTWIRIGGVVQSKLRIKIIYHQCAKRSLAKPKTWTGCVDTIVKNITRTVTPRNTLIPAVSGANVRLSALRRQSISSSARFALTFYAFSDPVSKKITVRNEQRVQLRENKQWLDFSVLSPASHALTIPPARTSPPRQQLNFPLAQISGVTQWHGNTAFQKPHTGIDFGVSNKVVRSPANGTITATGWDAYLGPCNSGGNYVHIRHDNGLHTVYFHLASTTNKQGNQWRAGNKITAGDQVGISGNTGAANCQPLSYHLHYETRTANPQSTHTNPVPLTSVDWALVPTLNWQQYPGRLTGDNPHPQF